MRYEPGDQGAATLCGPQDLDNGTVVEPPCAKKKIEICTDCATVTRQAWLSSDKPGTTWRCWLLERSVQTSSLCLQRASTYPVAIPVSVTYTRAVIFNYFHALKPEGTKIVKDRKHHKTPGDVPGYDIVSTWAANTMKKSRRQG